MHDGINLICDICKLNIEKINKVTPRLSLKNKQVLISKTYYNIMPVYSNNDGTLLIISKNSALLNKFSFNIIKIYF